LEGLAQTWWDTVLKSNSIVIDISDPQDPSPTVINIWADLCKGLHTYFYPLGYLHQLLAKWLQLRQLSGQSVHAFIEVFCKLRLQLQVMDPKPILVIKFNSSMLFPIKKEIDLFQSTSLDQAFQRALAAERKIAPRPYHPNTFKPAAPFKPFASHNTSNTSSSSSHP